MAGMAITAVDVTGSGNIVIGVKGELTVGEVDDPYLTVVLSLDSGIDGKTVLQGDSTGIKEEGEINFSGANVRLKFELRTAIGTFNLENEPWELAAPREIYKASPAYIYEW